jgi:4-hydroxy-tetrahydrodipicolinate synthase
MNRDELKKLIQGPVATVPTPFTDGFALDLGRTSELTRWWVDEGLVRGTTVIKIAAAMGEGPDLTDDEWPRLLQTTVEAAGDRGAVVCGLKPKDTLHTIEDALRAADLGAIGVQIDLPIFHHPTQDDMVRFFSDISDAIDIGIVLYNTWWFAPPIEPATLVRLRDAEHLVAIKWSVPKDGNYDAMRDFAHIYNVIDNSSDPARSHRLGARGFISSLAAVNPRHDLEIWRLLEAKRYEEAEAQFRRTEGSLREMHDRSAQRSGGYRILKGLMAVTGQPVGPPRPPTLPLDAAELAELRALVRAWGWPVAERIEGEAR